MNLAAKIIRIIFSALFRTLLPLKKNRLIFFSHHFKQYSCNTRYIAEFIAENYKGKYQIYWAIDPEYLTTKVAEDIVIVNRKSLKYVYIINTSRVVLNNTRDSNRGLEWIKRKNQFYIQTWHASMGIKKIEGDASLSEDYKRIAIEDAKRTDLMISGCRHRSETIRRAFWFTGPVLECGTPRNDILFSSNKSIRNRILKQYSLSEQSGIVLYAPTARKEKERGIGTVDFDGVVKALREKFKQKDWVVLYRLHPNLIKHKSDLSSYKANVIDVTLYPDMQELLLASDILITDYSSSMFDMALLKKPCFLHIYDLEHKKDSLLINPLELPFSVSTTDCELIDNILAFDSVQYHQFAANYLHSDLHSFETGNARRLVVEYLVDNYLK
jgi:CDP-glycerol glycerophosphotransferase